MNFLVTVVISFLVVGCTTTNYKVSNINIKEPTTFQIAEELNFENKIEKAIYLYKKDFYKNNNTDSALSLARLYRYKIKDFEKMEKWYINSYHENNDYSLYELANYFYVHDNFEKALKYYTKSTLNKRFGLDITLSRIRFYSISHIKIRDYNDYKKSINHMDKAVFRNNLNDLKSVYPQIPINNYKKFNIKEKPYLIPAMIDRYNLINLNKISYYKSLNTKESNYELARLYIYVYKEIKTSIDYYKKAHRLGNKNAAFELAELYKNNLYDIKNTIYWYKESYKIGNKNAAFSLALFFDFKLKAFNNAIIWYKKSFRHGHKAAATNISLIYKDKIKDVQRYLIWNANK